MGAGPPGSHNDMDALRSHPFFASINWATLWTDQVPPLESGLVKKEIHTLHGRPETQDWEDVGAAWDELVDENGDGDGVSWASDAEGGSLLLPPGAHASNAYVAPDDAISVGPRGEQRTYGAEGHQPSGPADSRQDRTGLADQSLTVQFLGVPHAGEQLELESEQPDAVEVGLPVDGSMSIPAAVQAQPIDVPQATIADSHSVSAGSGSSSSEGSPVGRLDASMAEASLNRGRPRAQTPIQNNYGSGNSEWYVNCDSSPFRWCVADSVVASGKSSSSRMKMSSFTPSLK